MGCAFATGGCEILLSLSEQAAKPVNKSNATKALRKHLCFSIIYMPAPLADFDANIAEASDLFKALGVSGPTHKICNSNVVACNALP